MLGLCAALLVNYVNFLNLEYAGVDWAGPFVRASGLAHGDIFHRAANKKIYEQAGVLALAGEAAMRSDQPEKAKKLFQQALQGFDKYPGPGDMHVYNCLTGLATIARQERDLKSAARYLQRALASAELITNKNHSLVAGILRQLADVYRIEHRYDLCLPLDQRLYAIDQKGLRGSKITICEDLRRLGDDQAHQMQYQAAARSFSRAEQLAVEIGSRRLQITYCGHAANALVLSRAYLDAEGKFKQTLDLLDRSGMKTDANYFEVLVQLAYLYQLQGKEEKARATLKDGLAFTLQTFNRRERALVTTLLTAAETMMLQRRFRDAGNLLDRTLAIVAKQPADYRNTTRYDIVAMQGECLFRLGDLKSAKSCFETSYKALLPLQLASAAPCLPEFLLRSYAQLLKQSGESAEAESVDRVAAQQLKQFKELFHCPENRYFLPA